MSNDVVTTLNTCYQTASGAGQLYNGFLPIIWNPTEKGHVTSALEHKFILYVPTKLNQTEIPPTTENGVVFLYLQTFKAIRLALNQRMQIIHVQRMTTTVAKRMDLQIISAY